MRTQFFVSVYEHITIPHFKECYNAILVLAITFGEGILVLHVDEGRTLEHLVNTFGCFYDSPALKAHSFRGGMKTQTDASRYII